MSDAQHHGWLVWYNASSWHRCFAVLTTESFSWFKDTDSETPLGEVHASPSVQVMDLEDGHGLDLPEEVEHRAHSFVVIAKEDGAELPFCFGAEDASHHQAWMQALTDAFDSPKQLEAYIDDFSDYEDDTHARRSSLEMMEGMDWVTASSAAAARSEDASQRRSIAADGARGRRSMERVSVKQARMDDSDDDGDVENPKENATQKRSSLEMTHTVDWNLLSVAAKSDEAAEAADSATSSRESGDADAEQHKQHDAFQAAYGECW